MEPATDPELVAALEAMQAALRGVHFVVPGPELDRNEGTRRRLSRSIEDYILPRVLSETGGPVVAVIAGPGGVGKSTLLNTLARERVSEVGLARPTTKHPVLWANRRHADQYWGEFLGRIHDKVGLVTDIVVGDDELTGEVTLIDTPPLDLARSSGPTIAEEVLTLADICLFVTSASRYADAAPFDFLTQAGTHGVPVLFIINKVPTDPDRAAELVDDFVARLSRRGMLMTPDPSLVFTVTVDPVSRPHGGLDIAAVDALRRELTELSDPIFREEIMAQTMAATVHALTEQSTRLVSVLVTEQERAGALLDAVKLEYKAQVDRLAGELRNGDFYELTRRKNWTEAAAELAGILTRRAGVAADATADVWAGLEGGPALLATGGAGLRRHGEETPFDAVGIVERWEQDARDHATAQAVRTRTTPGARRRLGRFLWRAAFDPNRPVPNAVHRRFPGKVEQIVGDTRDSLVGAFADALDVDAQRFRRLLADATTLADIDALNMATEAVRKSVGGAAVQQIGGDTPEKDAVDA